MKYSTNNIRLAKNTMMLYFRMILIMGVSFYTVRIIIAVLGVEDYGIFNVVAGFVVVLSFFSSSMEAASQRFLAFELGRNDSRRLQKTFSSLFFIYLLLAVFILIAAQTLGLWFVNTKMTIPSDRLTAANWVYHFAVFSFLTTLLSIPYKAMIIAHEKMKTYAYLSVSEAVIKLLIVYSLTLFAYDKLKMYGILFFGATLVVSLSYALVCRYNYPEARLKFQWDKSLFRELAGFSGWNLIGATAGLMNKHGVNVLLNIYFGPAVNAARAIAYQVQAAITQVVLNYNLAVRPQITKYYSSGENEVMKALLFNSVKYSFFLLLLLTSPVLFETRAVLTIWLGETPDYVVLFSRLMIITALIDSMSYPMQTTALATGKIKLYQVVVGGISLFNIPVSLVFLIFGYPPQTVMYVAIVLSFVCLLARVYMLKALINLSVTDFLSKALYPVISVAILSVGAIWLLKTILISSSIRFFIVFPGAALLVLIVVFSIGLSHKERSMLVSFLSKKHHS